MIEAVSIGPLLVPTKPVSMLAAVIVAVVATSFMARRLKLDSKWASSVVEQGTLVGLLGSRVVFVVMNWSIYQTVPWTALFLWQPGYYPWPGMILGLLFVIWRLNSRSKIQRRSYLEVLGIGSGIGISVLLVLFLGLSLAQRPGVLQAGDSVADFSMASLSGEKVQFSQLQGKAVILNFWATWCPPCRREMPLLDAVQKEYAARGLVIVGINLSEPRDRVKDYIRQTAVKYPIWLDAPQTSTATISSRKLFLRFGGVGLPTTIFIDRSGRISDVYVGELNQAKLQTNIKALLASALQR